VNVIGTKWGFKNK
jgi:hypothetical protein